MLEHVLVIYKKSLHQIYFEERRLQVAKSRNRFPEVDRARFLASHETHNRSLDQVTAALTAAGIRHRLVYRARHVDYAPYSLILAVGGDGTFIEAARQIVDQPILGVNSDPERSVGVFCAVTGDGFADFLARLASHGARHRRYTRLELQINGERHPYRVLNDVLVAHHCPAAMSRYRLRLGEREEAQRSSGLWISTAAGSSGAIHSAGGRPLPPGSRRLEYRPRELFRRPGDPDYAFRGGILQPDTEIVVESMMREGYVYVDGPHLRLPLPYGNRLLLRHSAHPLRVVAATRT